KPAEQLLVESGTVTRADILKALEEVTGVPSVDLTSYRVSPSVAQVVPQSMAKRFNVLCMRKGDGKLLLAMVDPHDTFALEYVKMRTGFEIDPRVAYIGDLARAQDEAYSVTIQYIDASTPTGAQAAKSKERERAEAEERGEDRPRFVVATREKSPSENVLLRGAVSPAGTAQQVRTISLGSTASGVRAPAPPSSQTEAYRRLLDMGNELASTVEPEELIRRILLGAMELTGSEGASLILVGEGGNDLYFRESLGPRADDVKKLRFPLDERSLAGFSVRNRKTLRVNDVRRDPRHSKLVDEAVNFTTRSVLCSPVMYRGEPLGVIEAINKVDNTGFSDTDEEYLEALCAQAAIALTNSKALGQLQNYFTESVEILVEILEKHDHISRSHLIEVARVSTAIGRELNLSPPEIERLCYAALLHDIGKVKCSDPNDPAHAELGARMLERVKLFRDVVPTIRHHHEKHNGTGFPDGLREDEIPRLARILAVAEAWVEGLSERGVDRAALLSKMRGEFGTRFDPALKPAFDTVVSRMSEHS
ncbi:MAG: HD domain-containing phosphohydrolase, partial [Candidatus Eremiobacterota bacterium]